MSGQQTHIAISVLIAAVIAFFIGYGIAPRLAQAPTSNTVPPGSTADAVVTPVSIVSIRETASTSPTVTVEYPQFPSLSAAFNAAIASSTLGRLSEFQHEAAEDQAARGATAPVGNVSGAGDMSGSASPVIPPSAYSFIATWQPAQMNGTYVSFIERYDSFSGGANENEDIQTFNYDAAGQKTLGFADLFPGISDYLEQISTIARSQLADSMSLASNGSFSTDMLDAGTQATPDAFADFTFTDYEVDLYFPKCAVAACSFGEQHVAIPRDQVK